MAQNTTPDAHGNVVAREGCDRCECGCKYWEHDLCVDCGLHVLQVRNLAPADARHVSRLLGKAGLPRASKYSAWGFTHNGYIVSSGYNNTFVTTSYQDQQNRDDLLNKATQVLEAAGLVVNGRDKISLYVSKVVK